jgi:hypothetical protein
VKALVYLNISLAGAKNGDSPYESPVKTTGILGAYYYFSLRDARSRLPGYWQTEHNGAEILRDQKVPDTSSSSALKKVTPRVFVHFARNEQKTATTPSPDLLLRL